jgi:hypothetical protein
MPYLTKARMRDALIATIPNRLTAGYALSAITEAEADDAGVILAMARVASDWRICSPRHSLTALLSPFVDEFVCRIQNPKPSR